MHRHQDLRRHKVGAQVVLVDKGVEHVGERIAQLGTELEVQTANHSPFAYFENDSAGIRDVHSAGHYVPVDQVRGNHFLALLKPLDRSQDIPDARRFLEPKFRGEFLHLRLQLFHQALVPPLDEIDHVLDQLVVRLAVDQPLARSQTTLNVIVEANLEFARSNGFVGQFQVAGANRENLLDGFQQFPQRACVCVRTEVPGPVTHHATRRKHPWVGFVGDADVRVALVVLQVDVVPGFVLLDQVVFQNKRFNFGIRDDRFHVRNAGDQPGQLWALVPACLEIGAYPVAKHLRLADVKNTAKAVLENVDAWPCRQIVELHLKPFGQLPLHGHLISRRNNCAQKRRALLR